MAAFLARVAGAALLDAQTYEEVEADSTATAQSVAVVVLSSVASAIGISGVLFPDARLLIAYTATALAAWAIWSVLIYLLGVNLLPEPDTRASVGELVRTTGFATAPGMLRALGVIPVAGPAFFVMGSFWMLAAMFVAIRQALDYRHITRALAVCVVGWLLSLVFVAIIGLALARPVS
jgi:hypothetical protein